MGVRFRVVITDVEEVHEQKGEARSICRHNALAKARAVAMSVSRLGYFASRASIWLVMLAKEVAALVAPEALVLKFEV